MPGTFRSRRAPSFTQDAREADRRRGSARTRGYTAAWDKAAAAHRASHPLCLGCEAVGRIVAATVTDHIVPHKGDRGLFWDPDNRQSACGWHHDVVKQRLEVEFAAGRVSVADLRLDSAAAIKLTRALDPG